MKKFIACLLTFCLTLGVCITTTAENSASPKDGGVEISAENYYKMEKTLSALPKTFEATIYVPKEYYETVDADYIFSNYRDTGMYLKINKWGQPMLFYNYELPSGIDETRVSIYFDKCNVMTGDWAHLAITYESSTKTFYCYLNGEFKQSIQTTGDIDYAPNSPFFIGKDNRIAHGWKEEAYFKGRIKSLSMFSDFRTAEEIKNDFTRVDTTDENIICDYIFDGMYNKRVEDNSANNCNLWCPPVSNGVETDIFNYYEMENTLDSLPLTYEANIYIPSYANLPDKYEGAIIGNYRDIGATVYINKWKNPRIKYCYCDSSGKIKEIIHTFTKIGLAENKWLHLAIVYSPEDKTLMCYVDGVLKETLSISPPTPDGTYVYAPESAFFIGKDRRREHNFANEAFFVGRIRSITLFSDIRTAEEIAADKDYVDSKTDGIMAHYILDDAALSDVKDQTANGNDLKFAAKYVKENDQLKDYAYSFAIIGDTQNLNERHPENFPLIYDFIVNNAKSKKIAHVFGLGDITNSNTDKEWALAKTQISRLNGVVDYSLVRGNHDSIECFNKYFGKDSDSGYYNQLAGWCEAQKSQENKYSDTDGITNSYRYFTAGDIDYLVVNLDYGVDDTALLWAEEIIKTHPNHNVIINTHAYLTSDGTTLDDNDMHSPTTHGTYTNNGQTYWEKLISKYSNIVMVLSGHIDSDYILMNQSEGEHGNTVTSFLINPQGMDYQDPGVGMVAMFYFSKDGKTVQVEYYSTVNNAYWLKENLYTFNIDKVDPLYGDVNDDAKVNIIDLIRLKKVLAKAEVKYNKRTSDCNIDKLIDAYDLITIRQIIFGIKS